MKKLLLPFVILFFTACNSSEENNSPQNEAYYFPPITGATWETKSISDLGWNQNAVQSLLQYLDSKNTKSFIILVDGRIVVEEYFNNHTSTSPWYWASAGKTLTTAAIGIAEKQGLLDVNDKVSDYLGMGWTSLSPEKENLITIKHLLTMTSGLDDTRGDNVDPKNLQYIADAGTRWAYHNVYVKLQDVVAAASGKTWQNYFSENLRDRIGMTGAWIANDDLSVYWSNARSMARFGLLMLNNGKWQNDQVVNPLFFNSATTTSQEINLAYGYLWWINGQANYRLPQTQLEFPGSIISSGPDDMYMALGKNDQKIYILPSKKMVIVRMGDAADDVNLALSDFDNVLWEKISAIYE